MKKLVCAVAAVAAGVAMAEGIASANVVGYQNVEQYRTGKNFIGATFAKVDGTGIKIKDFKPNADFNPMSHTVTLLNEYGGVIGSYQYMDADTANDYKNDFPTWASVFNEGWFDYTALDNWDEESDPSSFFVGNTDLYQGQTLMLEAATTTAGIQFDGQVDAEDIELTANDVTAGQKAFLCNCTPVGITMGKILPNDDFVPMSHTITFLNEFGGVIGSYQYMDDDTASDYKSDYPSYATAFKAGWWNYKQLDNWDEESDPSSFCVNDQVVKPGEGFMMETPVKGAGVVIPSAL